MKARTLFILALALTTVIPLAPPALAHHSFAAEYDADKPGTLVRAGFTKESLANDTVIKVNGYRAKDGALRANGRDITLPDGRLLFVGGSSPGAPKDFPGTSK